MEKVVLKYKSLEQVLASLKRALELFEQVPQYTQIKPEGSDILALEEVMLGLRDSLIQRFEYSVDLLWKYLKVYLEVVLKTVPEVHAPKNIMRMCSKIGLLTENEVQQAITMIDSRNLTSHIYREEVAQMISAEIPEYYELISSILEKTKPEITK